MHTMKAITTATRSVSHPVKDHRSRGVTVMYRMQHREVNLRVSSRTPQGDGACGR